MQEPDNYEARAEIMWAGSLAHNGLTGCGTGGGDWSCHNMEHEVGGLFDVAHGAGLAALWGSWARYVYWAAPHRFEKFAINVMGIQPGQDQQKTILQGIRAVEDFYRSIGMPASLTELGVSPTDEQITHMAQSCAEACGGTCGCVVALHPEDMVKIYQMAR